MRITAKYRCEKWEMLFVSVCAFHSFLPPFFRGCFHQLSFYLYSSFARPKYVYKFIAVTVFPFLLRKFIIIIFSLLRIFFFLYLCHVINLPYQKSIYIIFFVCLPYRLPFPKNNILSIYPWACERISAVVIAEKRHS